MSSQPGAATAPEPVKFLASYAYFSATSMMKRLVDDLPAGPPQLFGDSGAHSARTLGITLSVDEYANWCQRWDAGLTVYANMDVIGAPQATWNNQKILEDRHGLHPLPVFHTSAPWSWLHRYLDAGHTYIALGKLLGNPMPELMRWLDKAFAIAEGRAVFHGFGMTAWTAITRFPFYSVDSTSWSSTYRFGRVILFTDQGRFVTFQLRDVQAILDNRDLIRAHGCDPMLLAAHDTYNRKVIAGASAVAWRRAEQYLRNRMGPVDIPGGPHNPVARPGRPPATPGLHLYLAETATKNFRYAAAGSADFDETGAISWPWPAPSPSARSRSISRT
jgi:hypothetical protein